MGVFDLLGQAGAGYTRGLATSEQLKFQQKDKEKREKEAQGYRQEQLKLALRKQQFEENQAAGKEVESLRQLAFKSLLDAKQSRIDNPDRWAGMSPDAKLYAEEHLAHLEAQVGNKAATKEDFLRSFSMFPEKYGPLLRGQQGPSGAQGTEQPPANMPAPSSPSTPTQLTPNMVNPLERMGAVPQFFQQPNQDRSMAQQPDMPAPFQQTPQVAPDFIPQAAPPPTPTYQGYIDAGFSPDYAVKAMKDYQSGLSSVASARRSNAAAAKDEAGQPYIGREAQAGINNKNADTGYKVAATKALGGRLELDRSKFNENIRQWKLEYAAARNDAKRKFDLEGRAQTIAEFTARSADLLRQVQAGLGEQHIANLQAELVQMAKIDPGLKLFADHFDEIFDKTLAGTYLNKEKAAALAAGMEQYGMSVASVVRGVAAGAAPNPFLGTPQGSTVGAPPPGTPTPQIPQGQPQAPGTPYAPNLVPNMPTSGLPPVAGLSPAQVGISPEMAAQFEANRDSLNNGTFGPSLKAQPRKGKPNTRSKPKPASKPKKQEGYVSKNPDKPKYMMAPKTQEMTLAQKKSRLEELRRKAKQ